MFSSSRMGLVALVESSSISSVLTAVVAVSRGGEGDFCFGELWPVAGSSSVAPALKKKRLGRVKHGYNEVKIQKEE